jgi:hypothetical protein
LWDRSRDRAACVPGARGGLWAWNGKAAPRPFTVWNRLPRYRHWSCPDGNRHSPLPPLEFPGRDPTLHPPTDHRSTDVHTMCLRGRRGSCSVGLPCEPVSCGHGRTSSPEIVAKNKVIRFAAIVKPLRTRWVYEWVGWSEMRKK